MTDIRGVVSKFDDSSDNTNLYVLDYFPYQISNNEKYSQVECCYQKRLKRVFLKKYVFPELCIYKFLLFMWLYSDLKVYLFKYKVMPRDVCHYLHIKKKWDFNNFEAVRSEKDLRYITKFLIRERTEAYMAFENLFNTEDVFMYINGAAPLMYINNVDLKDKIDNLASQCGLFLRKSGM